MLMTGVWLTLDATVGVFSAHFAKLGAEPLVVATAIALPAILAVPLFLLIGIAGQEYGRRTVLAFLGFLNLFASPILFALAVANAHRADPIPLVACGGLTLLFSLLLWAMVSAYLLELFPTELRALGYGITYSFPSIIPAFYPFYLLLLAKVMPYGYTPIVLLALGGVLVMIGAALSKDRRGSDLATI
jgi:hypothetical protein